MTAWALLGTLLTVGSGCAKTDWIDRTLVTVDVSGEWRGTYQQGGSAFGGSIELTLQQNGSKVTGVIRMAPGGSDNGPIEGTVSGDVVRYQNPRGELTGELQVNGDEMSGPGKRYGSILISLRRQQ
jgi:hypothetical protein